MTLAMTLNLIFSALVVATIVGGLSWSLIAHRRELGATPLIPRRPRTTG